MKKSTILYSGFIIGCCMIMVSCNGDRKQSVKEFYPSGKLKKSGWVNADKVPVDTTVYYFENGNREQIEVRDDSGRLNGISKTFNEDGSLLQDVPYINNSIEGFISAYKETGQLYSRIHHVGLRTLGDAYWYDEGGKIYQYDFYGFGDGHRNYIKYDDAGKIAEKIAPFIFMDSISIYTPASSEEKISEVFLLLSNAPKCRTSVLINYISKDSAIIKQDSIIGKPYYFRKEKLSPGIDNIIFYGKQYDSVTGKNLSQTTKTPVND